MIFRSATRDDLPRVNELREQVSLLHAAARPDMFKPGFPKEVADFLCNMFDADNKHILVAEMDGRIVAFACLAEMEVAGTVYRPGRRFLEIDEFGVDEALHRQGIGRSFFTGIRQFAKGKGFDRIELNMWEFNENALKFYEAIGFTTYRRYMEMPID